MEPILRVENLTKEFPGVKELDNVKFDLYPGEVHILVGENGAGKSTLSKCILGAYQPEHGEIYFENRKVNFKTPKEALANGIPEV